MTFHLSNLVALKNILIALVSSRICLHCHELTRCSGRTGRIGNDGLATSFFTNRDEDLARSLTLTLLETNQSIPDFLEEHIPEGFVPDGTGDKSLLHFDADSDDGEEEGEDAAGETEGEVVGGWGAPATEPSAPTPVVSEGWGAPLAAAPVAAEPVPVQASGWGAPAADGW